jgi:hypothetical protein
MLRGLRQASSPSASQRSLNSSYGASQSSTQSFPLSPSNRFSSGQGSGGSHETDILVVTTPPSLRSSSAAASRYSPASSTRSPFSFDPAPSSPLSPQQRVSSTSTDTSSPLARARHILRLSSETLPLQHEEEEREGQLQLEEHVEEERRSTDGEDEDEEEKKEPHQELPLPPQRHQQFHISSEPSHSPAAPPLPAQRASKQGPLLQHAARARPSTGGARTGAGPAETSAAERGFVHFGAGGVPTSAGGGLPSPHVPEIRGESAATARVLLQVTMRALLVLLHRVLYAAICRCAMCLFSSRDVASGCSSAPGHQQPVHYPLLLPHSMIDCSLFRFFLPSVSLNPPLCSLARDEAATLTWRRDVGVRAIAAVLGHGASGRATLDGSSCGSQGGFGVPDVAAPALSYRPFAPVVVRGEEHSAILIPKSPIGSQVSGARGSLVL